MPTNTLALNIVNKILSINPNAQSTLQKYQGKNFTLQAAGIKIMAAIDIDGLLIKHNQSNSDVIINIPLQSSSYLIHKDKLATFKTINMIGDKNFGQEILEMLAKLNLNGLYANQSVFMGFLIAKLENAFNLIKRQLSLMSSNAGRSISEYLLYESQDIVNRHEIEQFCDAVDNLRSSTDRLTLQIKRIVEQK